MIIDRANSLSPARSDARVFALVVDASKCFGAFVVADALWTTCYEWIAVILRNAFAGCLTANNATMRI